MAKTPLSLAILLIISAVVVSVVSIVKGWITNLSEYVTLVISGVVVGMFGGAGALLYEYIKSSKKVVQTVKVDAKGRTMPAITLAPMEYQVNALRQLFGHWKKATGNTLLSLDNLRGMLVQGALLRNGFDPLLEPLTLETVQLGLDELVRIGHISIQSGIITLRGDSTEDTVAGRTVTPYKLPSGRILDHKLEHMEIRILYPWRYKIAKLLNRRQNFPWFSGHRLLFYDVKREAYKPPIFDLELLKNNLIDYDRNTFGILQSLKEFAESKGYTFHDRRVSENELLEWGGIS